MSKISVASLGNPTKAGFLTKQGGSIKTWKKRWFVMKGDTLWYFKTQKDQDSTGFIKLDSSCSVSLQESKNKKNSYFFAVNTPAREYVIYAETASAAKEWVDVIQNVLKDKKSANGSIPPSPNPTPTPVPAPSPTPSPIINTKPDSKPDKPDMKPSGPTQIVFQRCLTSPSDQPCQGCRPFHERRR